MKTKHILILIVAIIGLSFLSGMLSQRGTIKSQDRTILALTDTLATTRVIIGGVSQMLSDKSTILSSKNKAIEAGLLEQNRLKVLNMQKASHIVRVEAHLAAARDSIPMRPPPGAVDTLIPVENVGAGEAKNYISVPTEFYVEEDFVNLTCGIDENRLGYYDVNFPTPLVVTIGDKKTGLWKTVPTVAVTTPSPYLIVTDITPIDLRGAKKWYQKPLTVGFVGIGAGVIIGAVFWTR